MAAATGNVTNQAVQFQNNGAPSRQQYGSSISCNGSTMTFSPFYMGNDTEPQGDEGYVITENWGFQINFAVPLDKRGLEQSNRYLSTREPTVCSVPLFGSHVQTTTLANIIQTGSKAVK